MSIQLQDIKSFIIVTQTLNLTRASEIIGITQPALSYSIKRLEQELGTELFVRLKNGLQLTKIGEEFKLRAHKLIIEWEEAQNLALGKDGLANAQYTFAIHPSVALYAIDKFIPQIKEEFSHLKLNFIHGLSREMTEKVINWEADFGIVINPVKHPDLVMIKLATDEVAIFHVKGAPNQLIYDKNLAQSEAVLKKFTKNKQFSESIFSENLEVIAKLTSLGLGLGVLPSRVAKQYPGLIKLKDSPIFHDELYLIYRNEKHKDDVGKNIIKTIKNSKI